MSTFTSLLAGMATLVAGTFAASAQPLTEAKAREIIAPWYSLFNVASFSGVAFRARTAGRVEAAYRAP